MNKTILTADTAKEALKNGKILRKKDRGYYLNIKILNGVTFYWYTGGGVIKQFHPCYSGDYDNFYIVEEPFKKFEAIRKILDKEKIRKINWPEGHFLYLENGGIYDELGHYRGFGIFDYYNDNDEFELHQEPKILTLEEARQELSEGKILRKDSTCGRYTLIYLDILKNIIYSVHSITGDRIKIGHYQEDLKGFYITEV